MKSSSRLVSQSGIAALFWHALAPLLIGVLAVNLAVRFSAANAVSAFGASFRQVAPLVTVGQGLDFLSGSDIAPIVGPVRADAAFAALSKTLPMLVIQSTYHDRFTPRYSLEKDGQRTPYLDFISAARPAAIIKTLIGAGHFCMLERSDDRATASSTRPCRARAEAR